MSKKQLEKIEVICDICKSPSIICRGTYEQSIKRNTFYRCKKCSPQRNKDFWKDNDRKQKHSNAIKSSQEYYDAIAKRDTSGNKNGMFGKKASKETIEKMRKARIGKIGPNATAWKGGKTSFTKRIKSLIETRYRWFSRVFKRDNFTCKQCGATDNLDAHHINPVVKIIKTITSQLSFDNESLHIEYVISHPLIEDKELVNGITLCRSCHHKAHKNWGSHVSP